MQAVPDWLYRGFTGHEHVAVFALINMNGRMYDPTTGQMLAPDNYISLPHRLSGYNRYLYADGNPLKYTDPSGNSLFDIFNPLKKIINGIKNVVAHGRRGENITFNKGLEYFAQGYIASSFTVDPFSDLKDVVAVTSTTHGILKGIFNKDWTIYRNSLDIEVGRYYTDESRSFLDGVHSLISRNSWEHAQQALGYGYTQARNSGGEVKRVDFFGGATFATYDGSMGIPQGVTMGSYINISINNRITGRFEDFIQTDPLYMHEFGHTLQSSIFGPLYLGNVGVFSLISAITSTSQKHGERWFERQASKNARRYFLKRFPGLSMTDFDRENPYNF